MLNIWSLVQQSEGSKGRTGDVVLKYTNTPRNKDI